MAKSDKGEITRKTEWNENITAPIKKGDTLGFVNIYVGDSQVGRIPITATEDVEKLDFMYIFEQIFKGMFKL